MPHAIASAMLFYISHPGSSTGHPCPRVGSMTIPMTNLCIARCTQGYSQHAHEMAWLDVTGF